MKNENICDFRSEFCISTDKGFSLLELLIVLLLLGLTTIIVLPSIDRGLRERDARQSALHLAAVARDLRARALSENALQRLILNPSENSYEPLPGKKILLSPDLRITAIEGGETVAGGLRQFLFFPNGSTLGGQVTISSGGGFAYNIRFDPLLGRAVVSQGK